MKKYVLTHLLGIMTGIAVFFIVGTIYYDFRKDPTTGLVDEVIESVFYIKNKRPEGESIGTGFLVSGRHIMTNNHVVGNSLYVQVIDYNGNSFTAPVVAKDVTADMAIIEMPEDFTTLKHKPVKFCNNDEDLSIGDPVVAIGHPWGLKWSVSEGIVSHKDRFVPRVKAPMIQTDTKVLQGNSGGPLFSLKGCVAAMNTLVISRSGEKESFGEYSFSIDGTYIGDRFHELLDKKEIRFFQFGVVFKEEDDLLISKIAEGSNAEKMNMRIGDRIISVNKSLVRDRDTILKALSKIGRDETFTVEIIRGGKKVDIITKNT